VEVDRGGAEFKSFLLSVSSASGVSVGSLSAAAAAPELAQHTRTVECADGVDALVPASTDVPFVRLTATWAAPESDALVGVAVIRMTGVPSLDEYYIATVVLWPAAASIARQLGTPPTITGTLTSGTTMPTAGGAQLNITGANMGAVGTTVYVALSNNGGATYKFAKDCFVSSNNVQITCSTPAGVGVGYAVQTTTAGGAGGTSLW
jgi:IPT/TIG domain